MIPDSHHRRLGPLMWGAVGVTLLVLALAAVYDLDPRIAGYAAGILVLTCLAICGVAFWLDARMARTTDRMFDQIHRLRR
jgi:uncharacterized membrane protein YccC